MAAEAGADAILFERLNRALSPQYTLKREIARGGMGVVYLAHDQALNRPVAVKLLMPEHASAALAARFVREAQVLAHLRHPSIVTVHQVSESSGLYFYVMEWLEGETLQDRLTRGPLTRAEVIQLGTDLLSALAAAHQHGWIHRDVKPGNIFLAGERAILTDFGIARPVSDDVTSLTETRQMIGTLAYMSPEQRDGRTVTETSDIYSAGLVLYEAMSGRRWWQRDSEAHDWSGVPSRLRTVLRKAMEPEPADRYPDAPRFRKELVGSSRLSAAALVSMLTLVVAVAAGIYLYLWPPQPGPSTPRPGGRTIRLQALDSRGGGGWGDSIGSAITTSLASYPDLVVSGPFKRQASELNQPGLVLTGSVEAIGDRLRATIQSRPGVSRQFDVARESNQADWRALADSLTAQLIFKIYDRDPSLPGEVLPKTAAGWRAWSLAEPLFTQARWGEAAEEYQRAEALDPTCLLCSFRINDIDRWLDRPHDSSRLARLQANASAFPAHYRQLMQAAATKWPDRIVLMDSAVQTRDFFLAWFHRGDEIFHRGPLFGRHRSEALADLERTVQLRPEFAPAWEHLAWLKIAEGDSAGAARALERLTGEVVDPTSVGLRFLLMAAFGYRFDGTGDAIINRALQRTEMADFPLLAMAPRLMLTFEAPDAALSMGRIFARRTKVGEIHSGLLAQVFGHLARGQPDSALRYARQLQSRIRGIDADLFAAQLAGALALADPDSSAAGHQRAVEAREALRQFILQGAAGDDFRRRAAWMVVLLAERTGAGSQVALAHTLLGRGTGPTSRYYLKLIQADQLARRELYDRALSLTDDWNGDDLVRLPDPFFSTIAHFLRSEWQARQGNMRAALSTLLWHEANDFATYPVAEALAPEVDLAFGTLARWKQAQMADQNPAFVSDACRGYTAVSRLWRDGNETSRARAALARERLASLPCDDG